MKLGLSFIGILHSFLERGERAHPVALELADPAFGDGVDGRGVEVVQLFAAVPDDGDEPGVLEQRQVLRDRLPGHLQRLTQVGERLPRVSVQTIEETAPARVGQRLPHEQIVVTPHRQPFGCLWYATVWLPMSRPYYGANGA